MVRMLQLQSRASCIGIVYYILGGLSVINLLFLAFLSLLSLILELWEPILYFVLAVMSQKLARVPTKGTNNACLVLAIFLVLLNLAFGILGLSTTIALALYVGLVYDISYFLAAGVAVASVILHIQFIRVLRQSSIIPLEEPINPAIYTPIPVVPVLAQPALPMPMPLPPPPAYDFSN